ncbi:MAG: sigma-70 family RNA polymerase sigma factor [Bacteroidales bacterium]|nr:sigma-70 family RNA polymerase sigma factor [Bacteroidales bacterium]MDD4385309.1 sigma-70 family RNA polymerase sigma factor [Bacteroidales bacterium]MDY0198255.1 sigma-70 family RNA polymerase sigma factor [Tenuifilaceae bacterium]
MDISKNIVERCKKNDRKAQQMLYKVFSSRMYGVCLRYYPNADVARDILQDGFIKVFQKISSFRSEGSIEGWIRKIMVNTALEYHRKKRDDVEDNLTSAYNSHFEHSFIQTDYQLLLTIVSTLPKQYRIVFNLYAIEGYSHSEIAKLLEISESTSKSNYSRARAILREKVSRIEKHEHYALL